MKIYITDIVVQAVAAPTIFNYEATKKCFTLLRSQNKAEWTNEILDLILVPIWL